MRSLAPIPLDVLAYSCSLSQGISSLVLGMPTVALYPGEVNVVLFQQLVENLPEIRVGYGLAI